MWWNPEIWLIGATNLLAVEVNSVSSWKLPDHFSSYKQRWKQGSTWWGMAYSNPFFLLVSQWEPPPEFQQPQQEQRQHQAGAPSTAAVTTTTEGVNSNTDTATVTTEERGHKRSADEADLEKREVYQRPKIVERPYGQWTTVAVRYVSFVATETFRFCL